ncbi:hypothetical protein SAMN04489759_104325 [Sulfitobacter delicatus]|uniref:Uncharacterized protein n=1 Tax=Sulfitobacter delicatus TaxID=218672 RepID=A0A1G7RAB2_9RHOB|nr:hypothetical protein SAMN04489759_104325 [Sulfitobacter delicatus]
MISPDDRQEGLDCRIKVLAIFTQDHTAKIINLKGVDAFNPLAFLA